LSIKNINYNPFFKGKTGEEEKEDRLRKENKDNRKRLIGRCMNN